MQYHLVKDIDLPANCFETVDGKPYGNTGGLTCIFQIWKRYKKGQRTPIKIEDRGYIRKCKPEEADTAIVVFGWGCGKVEYEFERKPNTTKMYLCTKNKKIRRTLSELDYKQFYKNTAYIPALSLQEINHLLNERINK